MYHSGCTNTKCHDLINQEKQHTVNIKRVVFYIAVILFKKKKILILWSDSPHAVCRPKSQPAKSIRKKKM